MRIQELKRKAFNKCMSLDSSSRLGLERTVVKNGEIRSVMWEVASGGGGVGVD